MLHADTELDEALRSHATELLERPAHVGDEALHRRASVGRPTAFLNVCHRVKYSPMGDSTVKDEDGRSVEDRWRHDAVRADDRGAAGTVLRGPAGRGPPGRGRRVRGDVPVGSLPLVPGSLGQPDDRCLDRPGWTRTRDDDAGSRGPRLTGDVPARGAPGQGRDHGRRDERRAGRGRRRRRLERRRARGVRAPVPGHLRASRHARGDAGDPPRPLGGAGRLVLLGRALVGGWRVVPTRSPRASPSVRRAARPGRGSWSAGAGRRGPSGLPPDSPTSST